MKKNVVIHGHFYQPPRENPWSGRVPRQVSAAPYSNWNERIARECYTANTASRVLDSKGRVTKIVNNYEYISFNFGATLFSWLEENTKNTYQRILSADKLSCKQNNGHGNAIAQAYNHTILPLSDPDDIRIQVEWGLKDFEARFNRKSEGLWLPEAAINNTTADILIEMGIDYIVLSPYQIARIYNPKDKSTEDFFSRSAPSDRSFILNRPAGKLHVFTYNRFLSEGISFNHYLRSADQLFTQIKNIAEDQKGPLVTTVTDGEVYGHHEAFGDMCLASLVGKIHQDNQLSFTNYGRFLEMYPPFEEIELKKGENKKGTSWSCSHGVSRWEKDCGCSAGGKENWNQRWRKPLRDGFSQLRNLLYLEASREIEALGGHPFLTVVKEYIQVIVKKESPAAFSERFLPPETTKLQISRFLSFCEGVKFMHFMFTSCGWFFSDISGIESIQNLKYAYRAIELIFPEKEEQPLSLLLPYLGKANSNIEEFGNGEKIFKKKVLNERKTMETYAAVFILSGILGKDKKKIINRYGFYTNCNLKFDLLLEKTKQKTVKGSTLITNESLLIKERVYFYYQETPALGIKLNLGLTSESLKPFELKDLPVFMKEQVSELFAGYTEENFLKNRQRLLSDVRKVIMNCFYMGLEPPTSIIKMGELYIHLSLAELLNKQTGNWENEEGEKKNQSEILGLNKMKSLLSMAMECRLSFQSKKINDLLSSHLSLKLKGLNQNNRKDVIKYIATIMSVFRKTGFEPDIPACQNYAYYIIHQTSGNKENWKLNVELGDIFAINVEEFRTKVSLP